MKTTQQTTTAALDQRTHDHNRSLDITICALEESSCPLCQGLIRLLKVHLVNVAVSGMEVLN